MKFSKLPIKNPIGWGILAGAVLIVSSPTIRKTIRKYTVKSISAIMGSKNTLDRMINYQEKESNENQVEKSETVNKKQKIEIIRSKDHNQNIVKEVDSPFSSPTDPFKQDDQR